MASAVAAIHPVRKRHAVLFHPDGMADLNRRFFRKTGQAYRIRRTNLGAFSALRTTVTTLIRHFGLHQGRQTGRRPQYAVGTYRHAELAAGTVGRHIPETPGSGRDDGRRPIRYLLVQNNGQAAVHFFLLRPDGCRSGQQSQTGQKTAAGCIRLSRIADRFESDGRFRTGFRKPEPITDGSLPASVDTIHTIHAPAVIDPMLRRINAGRFAFTRTKTATVAFFRIDHRTEQGIPGKKTQHRTHRANRIAISTTVTPRQHDQRHESNGGHEKSRQAFHPHLRPVESVTAGSFGQIGQQVISPLIRGSEQVLHDAAVGTVRSEQRHQRTDTGDRCDDEQRQRTVPQPRYGRRIRKTVFFLFPFPADPRNRVLKYPQRADHRTVDTPRQKRQRQQRHDYADIQRQYRRQELNFRQPPEPRVQRSRKIEKQQCDQRKTDDGERYSYFSQHRLLYIIVLSFPSFTPRTTKIPKNRPYRPYPNYG